ncbi:MAG TPA: PVC-type heme-binding CxxCH protein [Opitutaceae bacterium]|nr:PVC-type heme-binding CxxCH protein [Opitutaceae bacterium]
MRFSILSRAAAPLAAVFFSSLLLRAAEVVEMETDLNGTVGQLKPFYRFTAAEIAPASNEGELALKRMKLPDGLVATLWAAEPMLANPVAFNFDERGRIFVSETHRYRSSVLDIRDYMWMLEDDLANRTIEDQSASILRHLKLAGAAALSIESERVRLLQDTNGDGKADRSTLFAEGFNSPLDGIASGVLARRGKVWFTNIPSLWLFEGETKDGAAAKRTELSRGYGVRFNFTGHDLHGLVFGPDGKLYFSVGDRGAHAVATDGSVADAPDTGSVFRCNPDGTQLEIFATGLRNPQSLLFNEAGDLFTGDNDSDQGDEERLVHIVENGDSGWRVGYQHAPLGKAGPWNFEKLWHPRFEDQAAYLLSPICNIEDGPSGVAYYPGTGLNENYRGSIFITHFKGSIPRSGIYDYTVKPNGASYAIEDCKPFLTSALPTDVRYGPDGKLYYSDWAEGWPKSKKGRIYAISDPLHANDPLVKETQVLIAADWTKKTPDELATLLGHADWRVRLEAQFTLAERGAASVPVLSAVVAKRDAPPFARRHAIWGLGQIAGKNPAALAPLRSLGGDDDAEVRAQALHVLGDHRDETHRAAFLAALEDDSHRVKFFAAQALGKLAKKESTPALLAALRANDDNDNFLRHALVMGLVGSNDPEALIAAIGDESRAARLGVLLALRRLGRPEIARFLGDPDRFLRVEAARAINDAPIEAALPSLAGFIAAKPAQAPTAATANPAPDEDKPADAAEESDASGFDLGDGFMLRVLNANFRLGTPAHAEALAKYAARADAPALLRAEALTHLADWPKPPARDRLVGIYRPLSPATRDAAVARNALSGSISQLLSADTPREVQTAALKTVKTLQLSNSTDALFALLGDSRQSALTRAEALRLLEHFKYPRLPEAVKLAAGSESSRLRLAALPIAARLAPDDTVPVVTSLITQGNSTEQKAAFTVLGTLKHPAADALLIAQLRQLAEDKVAPSVQLELLEAAAKSGNATIKQLLAEHTSRLAADANPLAPFRSALSGGTAEKGRKLFNEHPVLACIRCHKTGTDGGDAGPNLAGAGTRYSRDQLLESIVKPSAKIAPGFETVVVTLKSGAVQAGTVSAEDDKTLTLKLADNATAALAKADIAKREGAPSSMPEIYAQILTKAELRDLVEYLSSLKNNSGSRSNNNNQAATPVRALRGRPGE